MTIDQLIMFKTVAEAGSLKAASELLHKTQPAISQGIKQLETLLDLALFNRDGYRLVLTEEGKRIFQHAQRLLNEAAGIKQMAKHLASGNEPSITLAFEASFDLARVLPVLEITQNEFPNTQIILKQEYITGALDALNHGQADIVISPIINPQATQLEMVLLHKGKLIDVAAPRLLIRHPNLSFSHELLNEYQIIVQDTGTGTQNMELGVQDGQRRWYVNDFHTKKMLIQSGMGWGKLPDYLVDQEIIQGALIAFKLQDKQSELQATYYALKLKTTLLGPVASKLWKNLSLYGQQTLDNIDKLSTIIAGTVHT